VLFNYEGFGDEMIHFSSLRSGVLKVSKKSDWYTLDFPADKFREVAVTDAIAACFDKRPAEVYKGRDDYMFVYDLEEDITHATPRFDLIAQLDVRGVIITAKGGDADFVSRFFAPQVGVDEDPVTGSAHTTLTPYWTKKLNKNSLSAKQLSERGGYLLCALSGNRVEISGQAVVYSIGNIFIE
jgi:predicted PhzF superfamily epimerase YddE/YHI9